MDMLNQAYENHSNFMATSTEIWSELQDFTPSVVYHKGSEQTANEQNIGENQENTARSKENGVIQNSAYQAFLSAIQSDNQKLSQQYSGDWKDLRLSLMYQMVIGKCLMVFGIIMLWRVNRFRMTEE